jgi:hypothetical protein
MARAPCGDHSNAAGEVTDQKSNGRKKRERMVQ